MLTDYYAPRDKIKSNKGPSAGASFLVGQKDVQKESKGI